MNKQTDKHTFENFNIDSREKPFKDFKFEIFISSDENISGSSSSSTGENITGFKRILPQLYTLTNDVLEDPEKIEETNK